MLMRCAAFVGNVGALDSVCSKCWSAGQLFGQMLVRGAAFGSNAGARGSVLGRMLVRGTAIGLNAGARDSAQHHHLSQSRRKQKTRPQLVAHCGRSSGLAWIPRTLARTLWRRLPAALRPDSSSSGPLISNWQTHGKVAGADFEGTFCSTTALGGCGVLPPSQPLGLGWGRGTEGRGMGWTGGIGVMGLSGCVVPAWAHAGWSSQHGPLLGLSHIHK